MLSMPTMRVTLQPGSLCCASFTSRVLPAPRADASCCTRKTVRSDEQLSYAACADLAERNDERGVRYGSSGGTVFASAVTMRPWVHLVLQQALLILVVTRMTPESTVVQAEMAQAASTAQRRGHRPSAMRKRNSHKRKVRPGCTSRCKTCSKLAQHISPRARGRCDWI